MRLTGRTQLLVAIDPDQYRSAKRTHRGLDYLLDRLFSGDEVAESEFGTFGIQVRAAGEQREEPDLRSITEDDIELALGEGCFVELPLKTPAEVLEAVNCVLDRKLGREE